MRNGIAAAGNLIIDHINPISGYPEAGKLTTISGNIQSVIGGIVCNVLIDIANMDPSIPLFAYGAIGEDSNGSTILDSLRMYKNINTSGIITMKNESTAFTTVMSDIITNQRTFFVYRGSNSKFCEDHIHWDRINAKILHIGYLLLMDELDSPDEIYGTKMAKLLCHAQQNGIKTSIDIVSEIGIRFEKIVPPALKYTDYCIINEIEAQQSTGILLRDERNHLLKENIPDALNKLRKMGVSTWAVIHCPEGGFGVDSSGKFTAVDSLNLPADFIKDTVGAGDAFCSGVLYAAHENMDLRKGLELGTACAAASLSSYGSTSGMQSLVEIENLYRKMR